MLLEPPIDKLIEKVECKYALVCMMNRRARYLLDKKRDLLVSTGKSAVTFAANELYNGVIRPQHDD